MVHIKVCVCICVGCVNDVQLQIDLSAYRESRQTYYNRNTLSDLSMSHIFVSLTWKCGYTVEMI